MSTSDNPAITIKDTDSNAVTNAIGGGATNLSGVIRLVLQLSSMYT